MISRLWEVVVDSPDDGWVIHPGADGEAGKRTKQEFLLERFEMVEQDADGEVGGSIDTIVQTPGAWPQ